MHMTFTGERYVPHLRGQISYEHLHRYALAVSLAKGKDVLDIASGEGYGSALLAMVAKSVIGVDIDENSTEFSAARYAAMNLSFRSGSATQIPLADSSVDVVVSFETIEHLGEHERMLGEFCRVLRPDGQLIISSPNKLVYSDARGYTNPFHVRELYFHEFRNLLRSRFSQVKLFGHRIFAGSAVYPLAELSGKTKWLGPTTTTKDRGIPPLADPEYFIAVCGARESPGMPDLSSVYLDPLDELLDDVRSGGLAVSMHASPAENNATRRLSSSPLPQLSPGRRSALESQRSADEKGKLELQETDDRNAPESKTDLRKLQRREAEQRLTIDVLRTELSATSAQLRHEVLERSTLVAEVTVAATRSIQDIPQSPDQQSLNVASSSEYLELQARIEVLLTGRDLELKSYEQTTWANEETIRSNEETIRANEETILANEEAIRSNEETIRSNEETIRANEETIRSNEEAIRSNEEMIRAKEETIRANEEMIRANVETILTNEEITRIFAAECDALRKSRDEYIQRLSDADRFANALVTSTSWRATKPVRQIASVFRKT